MSVNIEIVKTITFKGAFMIPTLKYTHDVNNGTIEMVHSPYYYIETFINGTELTPDRIFEAQSFLRVLGVIN